MENQVPESVRVIKLIDGSVSPSAPTVKTQVPSVANTGETIHLSVQTEAAGPPAVESSLGFRRRRQRKRSQCGLTPTQSSAVHRSSDGERGGRRIDRSKLFRPSERQLEGSAEPYRQSTFFGLHRPLKVSRRIPGVPCPLEVVDESCELLSPRCCSRGRQQGHCSQ